jgi:DNA-binding beta-propeller fold protein YncE
VTVISGTQVITTLAVGVNPAAIGVNPANGYAYVANQEDHSVSIIAALRYVYLPLVMRNAQ